ncbi:unnamed protein product [Tuber melanosporum]|uniref:(Perigord truffle) hypothetical protein n=1 Tax=Tuber melanosporum (strain Mel28) TaxID=656061 RepID=D5GM70_TUBMM|nr:uncharacterized protein GSTUM_00010550001 [Tuber melanosporum]CAZ85613.1 unnamed protein product [Tuber melanosporum]
MILFCLFAFNDRFPSHLFAPFHVQELCRSELAIFPFKYVLIFIFIFPLPYESECKCYELGRKLWTSSSPGNYPVVSALRYRYHLLS